jgi:hypothetical protein
MHLTIVDIINKYKLFFSSFNAENLLSFAGIESVSVQATQDISDEMEIRMNE